MWPGTRQSAFLPAAGDPIQKAGENRRDEQPRDHRPPEEDSALPSQCPAALARQQVEALPFLTFSKPKHRKDFLTSAAAPAAQAWILLRWPSDSERYLIVPAPALPSGLRGAAAEQPEPTDFLATFPRLGRVLYRTVWPETEPEENQAAAIDAEEVAHFVAAPGVVGGEDRNVFARQQAG